jgi:hypothetical protein
VTRLTGASKNTVTKLLINAGKACADYHDKTVRNVKARRIQCDEIWSFCYAKQKNMKAAKAAPDGAGNVWTGPHSMSTPSSWCLGGSAAVTAASVAPQSANRS